MVKVTWAMPSPDGVLTVHEPPGGRGVRGLTTSVAPTVSTSISGVEVPQSSVTVAGDASFPGAYCSCTQAVRCTFDAPLTGLLPTSSMVGSTGPPSPASGALASGGGGGGGALPSGSGASASG